MTSYSLFELHEYIRQVIALNFGSALWIRAEIAQISPSSKHFYLDLIQKNEEDTTIIAHGSAVIWASQYRRLKRQLGSNLNSVLQEGVEVLVQVKIEFHERYGLKLMIEDIDLSYTLGKLALKRQKIIETLQKEHLLDKNKQISLPTVIQNIALISSENAAGLQDYLNQLEENSYQYKVYNHLFAANVQGVQSEAQIIARLEQIALSKTKFDAVVIIRGGGSKLDLSAFDGLELCKAVANFPLPVLCGIGHEVDETVLDLVVHHSLKTPTAVAEFLITRMLHFESTILEMGNKLQFLVQNQLYEANYQLTHCEQFIQHQSRQILQTEQTKLQFLEQQFHSQTQHRLRHEQQELNALEKLCALLSVDATLQRGFSISSVNGKALQSSEQIQTGDRLETRWKDGTVESVVEKANKGVRNK